MMKQLRAACAVALLALAWAGAAISATLLPPGEITFLDNNGLPLSGGFVYFYIPNTTTPKNTYKDPLQTTLNPNPVILDGSGRAIIYGSGSYSQKVTDSAGNLIWNQQTADTSGTQSSWGGTSSGSANAQIVTANNFTALDGQSISFIAGFTNTASTTLNPNGIGAINIVKDTPAGPVSLSGGEIVAGNVVTVIYTAAAGDFHLQAIASNSASNIGFVSDYAGSPSNIPANYLLCDGSPISRTSFAALFAVIGTIYGAGDGSTTFNLPDTRGRVIAGIDGTGSRLTNPAMTPNGLTIGAIGGAQQQTLVTGNLPPYTPAGLVPLSGLPSPSLDLVNGGLAVTSNLSGVGFSVITGASVVAFGTPTAVFSGSPQGGTSTPVETVQPTILMNKIIKYQ